MNFQISHISLYREAAAFHTRVSADALCLIAAGMRVRKIYGRDWAPLCPMLSLLIKGEPVEFVYGPNRESWFIAFEGLNLRRSRNPELAEFSWQGKPVQVPLAVPLPPEQVSTWCLKFRTLHELFYSPTPQNLFCVYTGAQEIFRFMIESRLALPHHNPAEHLKHLIDEDREFKKSLGELCRECGYSHDHLGALFRNWYRMTPKTYRSQKQMSVAMNLIANSPLAVKEIAGQLGFKHVSAFSAMFRRLAAYPPREAIKRFRHV